MLSPRRGTTAASNFSAEMASDQESDAVLTAQENARVAAAQVRLLRTLAKAAADALRPSTSIRPPGQETNRCSNPA
jgi:hypothetical protein